MVEVALNAWFNLLGVRSSKPFALEALMDKIEKSGSYDFIQGWGSAQPPIVIANSSNQHVRIPGKMKPHAVAVHPSATLKAAISWRSPVSGGMQANATMTRASQA